jgi:hypothetical protein
MTKSVYINIITTFLLLSGLCHIFMQSQTARWMSKPNLVRVVGGCLLLISVPCLWWRGWYFGVLFGALVLSGAWRLCFPEHSIHSQERSYQMTLALQSGLKLRAQWNSQTPLKLSFAYPISVALPQPGNLVIVFFQG